MPNETAENERQWYAEILVMRATEEAEMGKKVHFTYAVKGLDGSGGGYGIVTKVKKFKVEIDVTDSPYFKTGKHTLQFLAGTKVEIPRIGTPNYSNEMRLVPPQDDLRVKLTKDRLAMARCIVETPDLAAVFMHYYPILHPHLHRDHRLDYVWNQKCIRIYDGHIAGNTPSHYLHDHQRFPLSLSVDKHSFSVEFDKFRAGLEDPLWDQNLIKYIRQIRGLPSL